MDSTFFAEAFGFEDKAVYYPRVRPGYAAWVSLFHFGNGDLGAAFNEIRRGCNPDFCPPSLEFVDAMSLVYRETPDVLSGSNRDLISEYVCMKSSDGGASWSETGRSRVHTRHYWHVGFPDGRLVRIIATQQYRYEVGDERFCTIVEESQDGGNTWKQISRFMEGCFFYVHKFKKLRDGSVVAAGVTTLSFGPGACRETRVSKLPGQCLEADTCFAISKDGGYTWDGPHYVLPGISAWEPDFVELPDGSLLFINSTVQAGKAVRQIVRETSTGYVTEPMMEIGRGAPAEGDVQGGFTPETITMTHEGLIVGARRHGVYSCSNDLGENWYEIADAPVCGYQPIIEYLPDGRFLAVWHKGGDTRFGEVDMFIGSHSFRLEHHLPKPTALTLRRELSEDGDKFTNVYCATLTSSGKPLAGRGVNLYVFPVWLPDSKRNPLLDSDESPDVRGAVTDENGVARFALTDMDAIPDIHHGYKIAVSFTPRPDDDCASCKGPQRYAYPLTPARNCPANHPVYLNQGLLMIVPETASQFPELADVVAKLKLGGTNPDATLERWAEASDSEVRAREILDFLLAHHMITLDGDGVYRWYRSIFCGDETIKEVRICDVKEYCV